jgi:protein TonB
MAPGDHELAFATPGRAPSTVRIAVDAGAAQSLGVPELAAETPASTAAPRKPRKRVEVAPPPPPPAPEPAPAVVEPPPPPPVHRGDLVEFGPGVVRPKLLRPLSADYPAPAKRQHAEARIGVAVLVDENGKVVDARIAEGDGRGLGFEEVSLRAARAGSFQPATKNGVAVKMWHTVYLTFRSK